MHIWENCFINLNIQIFKNIKISLFGMERKWYNSKFWEEVGAGTGIALVILSLGFGCRACDQGRASKMKAEQSMKSFQEKIFYIEDVVAGPEKEVFYIRKVGPRTDTLYEKIDSQPVADYFKKE